MTRATLDQSLKMVVVAFSLAAAACPQTTIQQGCVENDPRPECQVGPEPCQPGDPRPQCQQQPQVGTAHLTWTVNPPEACAGAQVAVVSTSGPAPSPVQGSAGCEANQITLADLPAGAYTFNATLSGGSLAAAIVHEGITVTVPAGGQGSASFTFTAGPPQPTTANVNVTVTVNDQGGASVPCPANATLTANVVDPNNPGTPIASANTTCDGQNATPTVSIAGVAIPGGPVDVQVSLSDGNHPAVSGQAAGVTLNPGDNAVPVTLVCDFCGGGSGGGGGG
jgi:hypothetical protein